MSNRASRVIGAVILALAIAAGVYMVWPQSGPSHPLQEVPVDSALAPLGSTGSA